MAPSLAAIPDHVLWLGLGIFTFLAINHASHGLHTIRTSTRITKPPVTSQPTRLPSNPTLQEDAITTSSLLTLATSPNIDIRSSATKILCQRFYASKSARRLLVADLASLDAAKRQRATRGFELLRAHGVFDDGSGRERWRLHEPRGMDAQDLRRRRREAVVIHDGDVDRPVGEEDVFMRGPLVRPGTSVVTDAIARNITEAMDRIEELEASLGEVLEGMRG